MESKTYCVLSIILLCPLYTEYLLKNGGKNTLKCSRGEWGQYDNR